MKKLLTSAAAVALLMGSVAVWADNTGPGCGAGELIFKGKTGLFPHTAAATTNQTYSNQLLGMSFDSAGCDTTQAVKREQEPEIFARTNQDLLAADIARGSGEHLAALGAALGVAAQDRAAFYTLAQAHYEAIVSGDMVETLYTAMATDTTLSKYLP